MACVPGDFAYHLDNMFNRQCGQTDMKKSQRLKDQGAYVEQQLVGTICDRCGATLKTFSNACTAELSEDCPGFRRIYEAKIQFNLDRDPNG